MGIGSFKVILFSQCYKCLAVELCDDASCKSTYEMIDTVKCFFFLFYKCFLYIHISS